MRWSESPEPPKPISCSAEALRACEAPLIEPDNATMADAEEVDAINRARWERCVLRQRAALACFRALREVGVLR
jgi:hypothetical protein